MINNKLSYRQQMNEVWSLMDRLCDTTLLLEVMDLDQIHQKHYPGMSDDDFWTIVYADPTYDYTTPQKRGKYTQWLLNLRKANKLDMTELSNAFEYLETYDKFKNRIGGLAFDNTFTVSDLGEKVRYYIDNPNEPTSKTDARNRIKDDGAKTVYEDNEWVVKQIFTKEAAIEYGKNTQWCTAATGSENYFDKYVSRYGEGCLYINIDKKTGRKYQFCFESDDGRGEFNDAENNSVYFDKDLSLSDGLVKFYTSEKGMDAALICRNPQEFYSIFGEQSQEVIRIFIEQNRIKSLYFLLKGNFVIPDGVCHISANCFSSCFKLTSITIPDSVISIGKRAFFNCRRLTSVTIPDSIEEIPYNAFGDCRELASLTIGASVTFIRTSAFSGCDSLKSVTIPNSVKVLEHYAFSYCVSLTSVTLSNSLEKIGHNAFAFCENLTSITIPDSVTEMGESAFAGCSALTSITIPNSVTKIGNWMFMGCNNLTIYVSNIEQYVHFKSEQNVCTFNLQMIQDRPVQAENRHHGIMMETLEELLRDKN